MAAHFTEELFLRYVPEAFLAAAVKATFVAHATAVELAEREFAPPEAENLVGFLRRGKLEGLLRDAAEQARLSAEAIKSEGPWNHVEVRSGPVVLTASAVQTPCEMVDKAEFRCGLAQAQLQLPGFQPNDENSDPALYALLLHSKSEWTDVDEWRRYRRLPGSVYLAFPSRDLDRYIHVVNLMDRFPSIVTAHTPQEWDAEAQVRYLRRARRYGVA